MRHYRAVAGVLLAADAKSSDAKTRVGTCEDAKKQMEYFCNEKNAKNDSMVQMGTACPNARNNVKEACEGKVGKDHEYKFDKK